MRNLWEVTFDAKYTGIGDLQPEKLKVTANGDGMKAVAKAKRQIVGSTFEDGPINGEWVTRRCRWVKLVGLELLHSIDV